MKTKTNALRFVDVDIHSVYSCRVIEIINGTEFLLLVESFDGQRRQVVRRRFTEGYDSVWKTAIFGASSYANDLAICAFRNVYWGDGDGS